MPNFEKRLELSRLTFAGVAAGLLPVLLLVPAARMPFVDRAAYERTFSGRENRKPAALNLKPPSLRRLPDTVRNVESWFTDRFGFRMELIKLKARLYILAGVSPREDLILLGKEDWFFLGNSHNRVIEKTMGQVLFTDDELEAYVEGLEEKRRVLAARGVPFMAFIAPNKHAIYPELLPRWIRNPTGRTLIDQLTERLRGGKMIFEDLTDDLLKAKADRPAALYYKADSHWNEFGAYIGYLRIMEFVREKFPGARVLENLPFRPTNKVLSGNAVILGAAPPDDEVLEPVFGDGFAPLKLGGNCGERPAAQKSEKAPKEQKAGQKQKPKKQPADATWRNPDDGYLALFPNSCRRRQAAIVTGSGLAGAPRVLVLGDSFMKSLSPYLNQSFGEVYHAYHHRVRDAEELLWYVEKYSPDLVIWVTVARAINPEDGLKKDGRPNRAIPSAAQNSPDASVPPSRPVAPR